MVRERGIKAADAWGRRSGFLGRGDKVDDLTDRMGKTIDRMLALKPRTPAGIAAVAKTLKDEPLADYWADGAGDNDWAIDVITQFLDGLIERASSAQAAAATDTMRWLRRTFT
jgi:hypothetical protein